MQALPEDFDAELADFWFEDIIGLELVPSDSGSCLTSPQISFPSTDHNFSQLHVCRDLLKQASDLKLGKRKIGTLEERQGTSIRKRTQKPVEKVIKLPDEVRTSKFADFMLGERFKFVPESSNASDLKLYSFPKFSRCHALSFFPSTFASFINSGDMDSLSELYDSFLHRSCSVNLTKSPHAAYPYAHHVSVLRMFSDLHPDLIMCMHSTKEVNNEIRSKIYFKMTVNRTIYESVARSNKSPEVAPYLVPSRAEVLLRTMGLPPNTFAKDSYHELLDSDIDIEVNVCSELILCFNKHSKKVMQMNVDLNVTSVRCVDYGSPDNVP